MITNSHMSSSNILFFCLFVFTVILSICGEADASVFYSNIFMLDNQNPMISVSNPFTIDTLFVGQRLALETKITDKHLSYFLVQLFDDDDNLITQVTTMNADSSIVLVIPPVLCSDAELIIEAVDTFGNASDMFIDNSLVIQNDVLLPPSNVSISRSHGACIISWNPSLFSLGGVFYPADYYVIMKQSSQDHNGQGMFRRIGISTDRFYIDHTAPEEEHALYQIIAIREGR